MVQTERVPGAQAAHANFQWVDSLLLELQLTAEERMIRDTTRQYAQEQVLPRETEAYLNEETRCRARLGVVIAGGAYRVFLACQLFDSSRALLKLLDQLSGNTC